MTAAAEKPPTSAQPTWLTREEAALYITARVGVPITATILANKASLGGGPPYRIWGGKGLGRGGRGRYAVYRPSDLDTWIESQLHDPSTKATANGHTTSAADSAPASPARLLPGAYR